MLGARIVASLLRERCSRTAAQCALVMRIELCSCSYSLWVVFRPMASSDTRTWPLQEALKTAQAVLADNLGIIEGSIALAGYAHHVVPDWHVDPDFVVFANIADETDHLPFGSVRTRWSADALAKADAEIEAIEAANRAIVRQACSNVIARFSAGAGTITLYRPVGPKELELIAGSGWREFPPRLPDQPIFYPVTNEAYAAQIARDWNVKESGAGFVTRFSVDAYYLSRYQMQKVGAAIHTEYWIPAEELSEFNRNIVGLIEVTAEFR
jgi:hypothetical protein